MDAKNWKNTIYFFYIENKFRTFSPQKSIKKENNIRGNIFIKTKIQIHKN